MVMWPVPNDVLYPEYCENYIFFNLASHRSVLLSQKIIEDSVIYFKHNASVSR